MGDRGHGNILRLVAAQNPYAAAVIGRASRDGRLAGAASATQAAVSGSVAGRLWHMKTERLALQRERLNLRRPRIRAAKAVADAHALVLALRVGGLPQARLAARKTGWVLQPDGDFTKWFHSAEEDSHGIRVHVPGFQGDGVASFHSIDRRIHRGGGDYYMSIQPGGQLVMRYYRHYPRGSPEWNSQAQQRVVQLLFELEPQVDRYDWFPTAASVAGRAWGNGVVRRRVGRVADARAAAARAASYVSPPARPNPNADGNVFYPASPYYGGFPTAKTPTGPRQTIRLAGGGTVTRTAVP